MQKTAATTQLQAFPKSRLASFQAGRDQYENGKSP
jgi:hypothetical protein